MDAYLHVTAGTIVRGNLVPDAHVAAILFQNGVRTLYSNDRDFRKFESIESNVIDLHSVSSIRGQPFHTLDERHHVSRDTPGK